MKISVAKSVCSISKSFKLDGDEVVKGHGGHLFQGILKIVDVDIIGLRDLIIENTSPDHVFMCGYSQHMEAYIFSQSMLSENEHNELSLPKISRNHDNFKYYDCEGWLLLDYDPQDGQDNLTKKEFLNSIYDVIPELKDKQHLWKVSSSSNIVNEENGEIINGVKGQHLFIPVMDSMDVERISDLIFKKLWLKGYGFSFVDKKGNVSARSIIDNCVNSAGREVFIHSNCTAPLYQDMLVEVYNPDGDIFDSHNISDLTINEIGRYEQLVGESYDKVKERSGDVKKIFAKERSEKLGISEGKTIDCIENLVLYPDNIIRLSTGVEVRCRDIFDNPKHYDGMPCCDPLEPEYGGENAYSKAIINASMKNIYSFAHTRQIYTYINTDDINPHELALDLYKLDNRMLMLKGVKVCIKNGYAKFDIDDLFIELKKLKGGSITNLKKEFLKKFKKGTNDSSSSDNFEFTDNSDLYDDDGFYSRIKNEFLQHDDKLPVFHCFPQNKIVGDKSVKTNTVENYEFCWKCYGYMFYYDIMLKKEVIINVDGEHIVDDGDMLHENSLTKLETLCDLNGLDSGKAKKYRGLICSKYQRNIIMETISSVEWDGVSRFDMLVDSIDVKEFSLFEEDYERDAKFTAEHKRKSLRYWFVQVIAALDGGINTPLKDRSSEYFSRNASASKSISSFEYLLVFVGSQGVGKTSFIKSLFGDVFEDYVLTGHELNLDDDNNIMAAISHIVTELGEIGSTFKRSAIDKFKAFMSSPVDILNRKYDRELAHYKRRTVFCGSVNDVRFLSDLTGNRRFYALNINKISPLYNIDVEIDGKNVGNLGDDNNNLQLWAEILHAYMEGEQWWPVESDEDMFRVAISGNSRICSFSSEADDLFDYHWNDDKLKRRSRHDPSISEITKGLKVVYLGAKDLQNAFDLTNIETTRLIGHFANNGISYKKHKFPDGTSKRCCVLVFKKGSGMDGRFSVKTFAMPTK